MKLKNLLATLTLTAIFLFVGKVGWGQTTYVWNATTGGAFGTSTNWTPERVTPAADDILTFNDGGTYTVTGVATQTIGKLLVSNNTKVTLNATASTQTLTIENAAGVDLDVASGCELNISTAAILLISLPTDATASISGNMTFAGAAHKLTAASASSVTFNSGATFTAGTSFSNNPFGTTNLNSVIFASGSTYIQIAGSNPFGASQPNSVVVFQSGSLFKLQTNSTPGLSGRTYANLEIDFAGFSQASMTGSGALTIDNLTITSATKAYFNLTGGITINGDISVAAGDVAFYPLNDCSITFNGANPQSISVTGGTLKFGAKTNFILNQSIIANTTIDLIGNIDIKDKTISGTGTLNVAPAFLLNTTGNTTSGNKNITNVPSVTGIIPGMAITGTGIAANTVVVSVSGTGPYTIAVNNNSTATGTGVAIAVTDPASTITCSSSYGLSSTNNITITNKSFDSGATYIYNGSVSQNTGDVLPSAVANLRINNASSVSLTKSTSVTGDLNLINGKVILGNNILTVNNLTGSSSSNYIVTNGTGMLKLATNGTSSVLYPIGSSASSYTPVVSTNNTSGDFLSLKVSNYISNATLSNESCVKLEWSASEVTPGGNDGTITFQWNAADQGTTFNPSKAVYFGVWNGTKYDVELVNVTGVDPYSVTMNAPATYPSTPVIFGNAEAFFPSGPELITDNSSNNVDYNIEITFADDETWRNKITSIKDGSEVIPSSDYAISEGKIILTPKSGNSLKNAGSRTITVIATGYVDNTVTQVIETGAISISNSTLSDAPGLSFANRTTTVTATAKDQYENAIEGYTFKFDITTTDANATNDEEYTVAGTAYKVDATDVALAATNASGVATFDIALPIIMDGNDGISVQVQLNDGTTDFKTAISYKAPIDPVAAISPATIAEHALNNAEVTITIQNADFAATLTKENYTLNNAPAGLSVASITRTDDKNAVLKLAYIDADNDFDTDITNFSIKIAVAELIGATVDVTSNDITFTAVTETAPTVTIASGITSVTETTATWGGEATADGGEAVTEKGICWGTTTEPTVSGSKTTEGAGLAAITGNMTGLTANTKYYVRAYATNSVGTAYSAEQTFNTYSAEPTNHVTSFTAAANGANLDLSWANNNGDVAPTHYLIKASTSNNITDPTDFTAIPADNLTVGSDNGIKVVEATATSYSWSGLLGLKEYFFKIYPFTKNADNLPNYKTAAAPAANATTNDAPKVETFANYAVTGTSYVDGDFVGQDGSTWTFKQCASTTNPEDQINAPSPLLARGKTPAAEVKSGTITGGIGTLGFKYKQAFSTAVSLDIYVNDTKIHTVTTIASEQGQVKTASEIPAYITGDFTIKIIQSSTSAGQVFIDDVTWTAYAPANPVVAAPLFNPGAGTYIGNQNITITSATEGASIYYTTDGSTPTDASSLYTAPITLSASATVKARAYKAGMDASPIVSAAYVIQQPIEVANIAALRAGLKDGTVYKLTGEAVLTFQHANRNQKYIQDATGGILVDDAAGVITTTYNQYDGITGITGRMNLYGGLIQFSPVYNTAAATSTGNTVTPQVITLTELNTNFADYESELIKVNNVTFSSTGDFAASQNLNITDGSVTSVFRTGFATADYIGTAIPTTAVNIVAIAGQYNGTAQLTARSLSDFSDPNGISDNSLNKMTVYPNPFNNEIRFNGSDIARVTITSIIGQIVMDKVVMEENRINTQELAQGIYIVKFTNKKGESTLRKLIKE